MRRYTVFLLLLLSACAGQQAQRPPASVQAIKTTIEYLGPGKGVLPSSHFPNAVVLVFPYIPGAIFGNPQPQPLFSSLLSGEQVFEWQLADSLNALVGQARPLASEWRERGLSVRPAETRLARIGTFAFDAGTRKGIGAGGFIDPVSKDNLILLYVDSACAITGEFELSGERYRHDIHLPGPGFHWLRVTDDGPSGQRLMAHPADSEVRFSIQLLHLQRI